MRLRCKQCGNTEKFKVSAQERTRLHIDGRGEFISVADTIDTAMEDDYTCSKCQADGKFIEVFETSTTDRTTEQLLNACLAAVKAWAKEDGGRVSIVDIANLVLQGETKHDHIDKCSLDVYRTVIDEDEMVDG